MGKFVDVETKHLLSAPQRELDFDKGTIAKLRKYSLYRNNTIILTVVNIAFQDLFYNFECSLRRTGVNNVLYFALDKNITQVLQQVNKAYANAGIKRELLYIYTSKYDFPEKTSYKQKRFLEV